MSKNNSGLFSNTMGQYVASKIKPSYQKNAVTDWAQKEANSLVAKSKRQRDLFRTASIVVDEETGNVFFGRNRGIIDSAELHPKLIGNAYTKGILPKASLNNLPNQWNCAETHAINQALHAGAKLENLHMYTISTYEKDFGSPKKSCENCTYAYKGKIKRNNTGWIQ